MYLMKIEKEGPYLKTGVEGARWGRPIMDNNDNFYPSARVAAEKFQCWPSQILNSVEKGFTILDGRQFRRATPQEIRTKLGEAVKAYTDSAEPKQASKKKKAKTPAKAKKTAKKTAKAAKKSTGIEMKGKPKHLDRKKADLFEGHEFTGGPAVLILPGTTFRMERPTRDDFPPELRDVCRWS